jgi:hypothetical protein
MTNRYRQIQELEALYEDKLPKNWDEMSETSKLDWFGHRMLLDHREQVRNEDGIEAAKSLNFLSEYQLERRRRREVQSKIGSWEDIPPKQGQFHRAHIDRDNFLVPKPDPEPEPKKKGKKKNG